MKLSRLVTVALALAAALLMPATAVAAPAAPEKAPAPVGASSTTQEFIGIGHGPYNIAEEAAWNGAYYLAAQAGYPAHTCRRVGKAYGYTTNGTFWQLYARLSCTRPAPGTGEIVGVQSGRCVDVKGAGTKEGTQIQLYDCNGTVAQAWRLHPDGTIRALDRCMDVQFARTENGTRIGLNNCHDGGNQRWERLPNGLLRSLHSQRCLAPLNNGSGRDTPLVIWDCDPNNPAQQWRGSAMGV
ncbi:ricin-type beta-trefoil lectin domain protein [Streptomyces durbertensis]|uniref:Ricin-type beta-trefoil lectin domain protein n=1 Tax=Streptomyces durbertensis TaxID=2448886 RepID=A0ABR6EBR3_9ACTN|nr:RICIN domain-containing protein [Streptomyces durbertensis]MBB1242415.1 ricin-type beta-trefoil lectin domain protein [Streptomyces durbertensis]